MMIELLVISAIAGILLGLRFKVFVLVPVVLSQPCEAFTELQLAQVGP